MNKLLLLTAALGLTTLAACKPISSSSEADQARAASSAQAESAARPAADKPRRKPVKASPERIAEIVASGRTGLWSSVTEVCAKDRPIPSTMLAWNVSAAGAEHVVLYVVNPHKDTDGKGRPFAGRQDPVGERESGHWLRPGLMFKLRSMDDDKELGSVTIGEKAC